MVERVEHYKANDGTEFATYDEALAHERVGKAKEELAHWLCTALYERSNKKEVIDLIIFNAPTLWPWIYAIANPTLKTLKEDMNRG